MVADERDSVSRWLLGCGAICTAASAWVAQVPLRGIPHVTDEVSYTLQARLFSAFLRVGPQPDNMSMWEMPFWNVDGGMYSPFPVGWPALLAPWELLGGSAWLNPLLAGLLPWIVFRVARACVDVSVAKTAALLVAFSPGIWLLAGSRMSHTSVLVGLGVVMVASVGDRVTKQVLLAGALSAFYIVLARPFDALLLCGPLLILGLQRAREARVLLAWLGLPALATFLVGLDNQLLTGDFTRFPMSQWFDAWQDRPGCNRLGFGADVGCAATLGSLGHSPSKAMALILESAVRFDSLLLGLHGGLVLSAWGAWKLRARRGLVWVALVVVGYALYWSPGRAYGARFWHPLYLVVPIALAVPVSALKESWRVVGVAGLAIVGLSRIVPDLADRYWCVDRGLAEAIEAEGITEAVVFMKGKGLRKSAWPALGVDVFQCDPMLESGDGWMLADPTVMTGGLQFRHALPDLETTRAFMDKYHPGAEAWLAIHDVENDLRVLKPLGILATP